MSGFANFEKQRRLEPCVYIRLQYETQDRSGMRETMNAGV